jgi:hypothetical protein
VCTLGNFISELIGEGVAAPSRTLTTLREPLFCRLRTCRHSSDRHGIPDQRTVPGGKPFAPISHLISSCSASSWSMRAT